MCIGSRTRLGVRQKERKISPMTGRQLAHLSDSEWPQCCALVCAHLLGRTFDR